MNRRWTHIAGAAAFGMLIGVGAGWWWHRQAPNEGAIPLPAGCLTVQDLPQSPGAGMVWIPSARFEMGSEQFRPEEAPVRDVAVAGFWIDSHDVTNAQFRRFVTETGYVTVAERPGKSPNDPEAGSFVFIRTEEVSNFQDIGQWWKFVPGASWRHPEGPMSDLSRRESHPVVHVAYEDAVAYARWAGHDLPSEAQWEYAARGGLDAAPFVWGTDPEPEGKPRANYWHGVFPFWNRNAGGYVGTLPVGCFPANGFGLYDMAGNVWQWTRDPWQGESALDASPARQARPAEAHVIKGGSFLCADNFCMRYRPAARQPGDTSVGASHTGFRTVWDGPPPDNAAPK
ncbi:MAG: formylglycine-generating enzyme family protein [Xanthobacteraceae bacterium]